MDLIKERSVLFLIIYGGKKNDFATNSRLGNRSDGDNDSNISSTTNSGIYKDSITR